MKLNILSWLIWALFPLALVGGTYSHAVSTLAAQSRANAVALKQIHHDSRVSALVAFMEKHNFANNQYGLIKNYLTCADRFQTDWRLLPSVALAESSGGKRYPIRTNNFLGWNSANYSFQSETDALCFVSEKLAEGQYYRGKSTQGKLNAYNPNPQYAIRVIGYMNEITKLTSQQ